MTKKRFGYGAGVNWQEDVIIDYETEKSYNFYEVGKLLNELAEENNEFKIHEEFKNKAYSDLLNKFTQLKKKYQKSKKEKKELKQEIETLKMEIAELRESEKDNYNITDGLW